MRVKDWQDILSEVTESNRDPEGWRAVAGQREAGVGEDLYLGHPSGGVYHLKTYTKNPSELRGVGTQVARKVDEDIAPLFPRRDEEEAGRFAVQEAPEDEREAKSMASQLEETIQAHADADTDPDAFFSDVMDAVDSPAFGPMEYELSERPDRLDDLSGTFEDAESLLNSELDELIEDDDVGRGFH